MGNPIEQQSFPRRTSSREERWLDLLLPDNSLGYREFRASLRDLLVIGEGRWGRGDYLLGHTGDTIDLTEGMTPVFSFGEVSGVDDSGEWSVALSIHTPNDEGIVEFQISPLDRDVLPDEAGEKGGWSYATWSPGLPSPASGEGVREIPLDTEGNNELILVVDPSRRVLWLHDQRVGTNALIPITNFYNELMLMRGERNPTIALDHRRLFTVTSEFTDAELQGGFVRYNSLFRKVDPERLAATPVVADDKGSLLARLARTLRGKG